jgi:hypothetical protein
MSDIRGQTLKKESGFWSQESEIQESGADIRLQPELRVESQGESSTGVWQDRRPTINPPRWGGRGSGLIRLAGDRRRSVPASELAVCSEGC